MPIDRRYARECRDFSSCWMRIGFDIKRDSGPLDRFEMAKVDFGLKNGAGADVVLGSRSTWRVLPWVNVSAEVATAKAVARVGLDWKNDSVIPTDLDLDVGAGVTAYGIGGVVGNENNNISVGGSEGLGIGLRLQGHGVEGGGARYSMGVDALFFSLGATYTTDPD